MKSETFSEGKVKISVPAGGTYERGVFYNPRAELTRDISVAALQVFQRGFKQKMTVFDALSASGARGLRYAKEVSGIKNVILNDNNPFAVKIIKKNITLNKLGKKCKATKSDANASLRENVYTMIDLDPFGSPANFLDSAARSIYHKGFLAITATDQMVLCGRHPDACFKKYGIKTLKADYYSELGARIMISSIIKALAIYDRAFVPVLTLATEHYIRVFGEIEHSPKLNDMINHFGYIREGDEMIGPVYLGPIEDKKFCEDVRKEIEKRKFKQGDREIKLLKTIAAEADMPAFYYDIHKMAKREKKLVVGFNTIIESLRKQGYKASRTHFCETGIKTNAPAEKIIEMLI